MVDLLQTSIEYLKGVGPQRAELLKKEVQIFTWNDLLHYFPFRYVDRGSFTKINQITSESTYIQIIGRLGKIEVLGQARRQRLVAEFYDSTGKVELIWFQGIRFIKPQLQTGHDWVVFGKPTFFNGKTSFAHPEINKPETSLYTGEAKLQPIYSSTEKLSSRALNSRGFEKLIQAVFERITTVPETLPSQILNKLGLPSKIEALQNIHFPKNQQLLEKSRFRLKFEELFFMQLQIIKLKIGRQQKFKGLPFTTVGNLFNTFYHKHLPFELTNAQKKVIKEIRADCGSGKQMNRLLQGDVGSGKTIVAFFAMLIAADNGYQATLMAPTEILANQHLETITHLAKNLPIEVGLLTGSTKKKNRTLLHEKLVSGKIQILIGTHALIEDAVQFKNLGLVIIDEQHRFGVAQRAKLWAKNNNPPHILVMTATPIPRTLAMTLYGDLDVSVINELPPGRKPIETVHKFDSSRLRIFGFMKEQIALGRQVYVVYPLIEESETLDYKDLMDGYESLCRAFPRPQYQIGVVHGRMKPADKDVEMNRFASKQTQILVATTVIEVGVNVPNATVMIIESAERFGLSQLHQLRGRVGRGSAQSFCWLVTGNKLTAEGKTRMQAMVKTNNGFEIADVDLKLRGPGDMMGTKQSGLLDFKIADLTTDQQIITIARQEAAQLLAEDPFLTSPNNHKVNQNLQLLLANKPNWARIS